MRLSEHAFTCSTRVVDPFLDPADFYCLECGDPHADCECNSLEPYRGADLSNYRDRSE